MTFDYGFNIGDIIWLLSLIVWIISLFLINPIYKQFKSKNKNSIWDMTINWWNINIVNGFTVSNTDNIYDINNKNNEK